MTKILDVYLHRQLTGQLTQDTSGTLSFSYTPDWIASPHSMALSHSLPLQEAPFTERQCRGFFAGLLPEDNIRSTIAGNLGISAKNDYAMLAHIGGECAGAITFLPKGNALPDEDYYYHPLNEKILADILRNLPKRPLLAGTDNLRLSLAGAQHKIAVHIENGEISLPLGGAPSTHIIKPAVSEYKDIVLNEAFCMQLATAIRLPTAPVAMARAENIDYLLVTRYDRKIDTSHHTHRLHQEDFCQALGISPILKYQHEGGPSLQQCFDLLRAISEHPLIDLQHLLDAVIFNILIGNHDAHGKNFSVLYDRLATTSIITPRVMLAPFYDLICTVHYPELSGKMAMKFGGEYRSERLLSRHFEKFAIETALTTPMVKTRTSLLIEKVIAALETQSIPTLSTTAENIAVCIQARCKQLRRNI